MVFKRIIRNILGKEMYAAVHAFEFSSTIRVTVKDIFGDLVPSVLYTNLKSLFYCVVKRKISTEKRLPIDLFDLRQCNGLCKLKDALSTPFEMSSADETT